MVIVGPWDAPRSRERRAPLKDPDLDLVLVHGHFEHESRVRFAGTDEVGLAVPYVLRLPPGWAPGEDSLASLLDLARTEQHGLINVLLDESSAGVVAARLERPAAFARARLVAGPQEDLDDVVDDVSSVTWVDGETYGFTREPAKPLGRRGAYSARVQAEADVERLTRENERLRAQVTKWREEAGTWRKTPSTTGATSAPCARRSPSYAANWPPPTAPRTACAPS